MFMRPLPIVVARFAAMTASFAHVRGRVLPLPALCARISQLAAEGRHAEREVAAWLLAELQIRGPQGFNPGRRLAVVGLIAALGDARLAAKRTWTPLGDGVSPWRPDPAAPSRTTTRRREWALPSRPGRSLLPASRTKTRRRK